jgi:hypothetical protein
MKLPHLVDRKDTFYKLSRYGCFGNQLRVWDTAEEFTSSGYTGDIGLRYVGATGGGVWLGNQISHDCAVAVRDIVCEQEGLDPQDYRFCEAAPDHLLTIQGEVQRGIWGLDLRYSTLQMNMRNALAKEQHHANGLAALLLLREHLSPASYDDLDILLDWFDGHVVEFAAFSTCVGDTPGRNTLIWEVRKDGEPPGWHAIARRCRQRHPDGTCIEE